MDKNYILEVQKIIDIESMNQSLAIDDLLTV